MCLNNIWGQTRPTFEWKWYWMFTTFCKLSSVDCPGSRPWPIYQLVSLRVSLVKPDMCLVSELMTFWLRTNLNLWSSTKCGWLVSELPSFFPSFDGLHAAKNIGLSQGVEIVVGHLLGLRSVTRVDLTSRSVMAAQSWLRPLVWINRRKLRPHIAGTGPSCLWHCIFETRTQL